VTLLRPSTLICLAFLLLGLTAGSIGQSGGNAAPATGDTIGPVYAIQPLSPNFHLPVGQTFVYEADWRLWTAGNAIFRIENTGTEYHVTASADSIGVVAMLYRVADRFESYFDNKTLCSSRITKHTEEGNHRRETNIRFDYARRKALLDERNLKDNQMKHQEEDIPNCVTDVLSGIWYGATLPLHENATYNFPLNDGGKTVNVQAHVEGKEEVKTPAGTFQTLRVQPEADSGLLKKRGKIWVWYTNDGQHIPVLMRARMFWGTLTIRLVRIEKQ
jgi:hypothetical protein